MEVGKPSNITIYFMDVYINQVDDVIEPSILNVGYQWNRIAIIPGDSFVPSQVSVSPFVRTDVHVGNGVVSLMLNATLATAMHVDIYVEVWL